MKYPGKIQHLKTLIFGYLILILFGIIALLGTATLTKIIHTYHVFYLTTTACFPHYTKVAFALIFILPHVFLLTLCFYIHFTAITSLQENAEYLKLKDAFTSIFKSRSVFIFIIFIATATRLWYAFTLPFINADGDSMARLEQAKDWLINRNGLPGGGIWLPLHHWLIMLPSVFGVDIIYGSRFITLFFALFTFLPFYELVKKRFGTSIANLSCLLLAINPFHIRYSIITMTEVPYFFFAVCALLFIYKFIEKEKIIFLVLSSLCLNCCNLIRFEGWILSGSLLFLLLYYKRSIRSFLFFGILNSLSIWLYMLWSHFYTGNLIYGLYMSDLEVKYYYATRKNVGQYIIQRLSWDFVLPLAIFPFLLHGIWVAIKTKKELPWLILAAFMLAITSFKIVTLSSQPFWRYYSAGLFLLLPFISLSIYWFASKNQLLAFTMVTCIVLIQSYGVYYQNKHWDTFPADLVECAQWLKTWRQPGEKYLYESDEFDFSGFELLTNTRQDEMYFPNYPGMRKFKRYSEFNDTVFLRVVRTKGFRYMVYQKGTQVDSIFHLPHVKEETLKNGPQFDSVYGNNNYRVFRITQR